MSHTYQERVGADFIESQRVRYVTAFERLVNGYALPADQRAQYAPLIAKLLAEAEEARMLYMGVPAPMCDEWCGTIEDNARLAAGERVH